MPLVKAKITPKDGEAIEVLFNPTQYTMDRSSQFAEVGIPGLSAPILQFVRGNTQTLSMELLFDTYEQKTDVSVHTDKIYKLLGIESETHVPPICTFTWGKFNVQCVLDHVSGRFTLFLSDGTPVRAYLNCTFKRYVKVETLVREEPTSSTDRTKTRTVRRGETLDSIAADEYGDPARWRPIADANHIANPRVLTPGTALIIPALT